MLTNTKIKQIKIKLIKDNITQTDLAIKLQISKQYLNAVLNGRQENLKIEEQLLEWLHQNKYSINK